MIILLNFLRFDNAGRISRRTRQSCCWVTDPKTFFVIKYSKYSLFYYNSDEYTQRNIYYVTLNVSLQNILYSAPQQTSQK